VRFAHQLLQRFGQTPHWRYVQLLPSHSPQRPQTLHPEILRSHLARLQIGLRRRQSKPLFQRQPVRHPAHFERLLLRRLAVSPLPALSRLLRSPLHWRRLRAQAASSALSGRLIVLR
jgi:hypothetical protein